MKKKIRIGLIMLISITSILFNACKKSGTATNGSSSNGNSSACQTNNTAEFQFISDFNTTYDLYINGIQVGTLSPGSSSSPSKSVIFTVTAGAVFAKAHPHNIFYSDKTTTITVAQCSTGNSFTW